MGWQSLWNWCAQVVHSLCKVAVRWWTGDCELVRICAVNGGRHVPAMTQAVTLSLKNSRQLSSCRTAITLFRIFSVNEQLQFIISTKNINVSRVMVIANLQNCLQAIRLVNVTIEQVQQQRRITFDYHNLEHTILLEQLWRQLKPTCPRSNQRVSDEWQSIGFQGRDPATDFRGMGLLGLQQLEYFCRHYPQDAQELLSLSQLDDCYFPFAATGINMTAFVVELLQNFHLHGLFYAQLDSIVLQDTTGSKDGASADAACMSMAMRCVHDVYCNAFIDFGKLWSSAHAKDVMAFPRIFHDLKEQYKSKYRSL